MNKDMPGSRYGGFFAVTTVAVLPGLLPLLARAAEDEKNAGAKAIPSPVPLLARAAEDEKAIRVRPAAPAAIPDAKYNWGIFAGISNFRAEGVAPLRFCANDARSLCDAFTEPDKLIPAEQSFPLTSDRTGKHKPTRVSILKTIKYACDNAKEDSLILVSISTRGFTGAGKAAYILPKDGDLEVKT
jgi:hypothetical protein